LGIAPPFVPGQGTDRSNANVLIPVHRARRTFLASAALPPEWCSFGFFNKITERPVTVYVHAGVDRSQNPIEFFLRLGLIISADAS
jgi:hypothetical protein